jgi:oligogalacturonide transporter
VLIAYISFCCVHSSVMIPYYSLASEITDDYTERARMTRLRMGFSIFSSIVCVAVPGIIVNMFPDNLGYIIMSLSFGGVFMLCVLITAIFSREGMAPPEEPVPFRFKDFYRPFALRPFRQYLCLFVCCQVTMAVMSALFFFYVDFYYCRDLTFEGQSNMVGMLGAAIMFGMQIVALPFYIALIKRTSKTVAYIVGSVLWVVGGLAIFLLPAGAPAYVLYILAAVLGFGISGPGLVPHAMLPDVIDAGCLRFGSRDAGTFSGVANMAIQISQAVGVGVAMALIGLAGFVEQEIGAPPLPEQSLGAQKAIVAIMALTPFVFMSIATFVSTRYRLNKERHAAVVAALDGDDAQKAAALELL